MKKYREYMNSVRVSDTLHQRLLGLEASGKRSGSWKRYGTMAAALVLVCGLGAWGLGKSGSWDALTANFRPDATLAPEIADEPAPDIALVAPGDVAEPGMKTIGGYEVVSGSGENAIVSYYVLPYIEYGETNGIAMVDWDVPYGSTKRSLTQDEIIALMGGEDAVNTHLDWGMYALTGWAAWYEDGSFWGAYIQGQKIPEGLPPYASYPCPDDRFEFAVTAGQLPPTCFGYPESVTQEIWGLSVTADGYDSVAAPSGGEDASTRRVSFMKDAYGYRLEVSGGSRALTEERVSRLVRWVATEGLALDTLSSDGAVLAHPWEADPNYGVDDADGSYTCPDCGVTVPAGEKHYHTQGETHTCPICGEVLPIDVEHAHRAPDPVDPWEISDGHPLAPEGWNGPSGSPDVSTETSYD